MAQRYITANLGL